MGVGQFEIVMFAALLSLVGCSTKANPNSCCTTADQCTQVGLKDVTSCSSGNVCDPYGACVMPQCSTSADCTSADAPICTDQLCVAKCTVDAECASYSATRYCGTDGACVACKDDTQCSADKPVCDAQKNTCRGCSTDAECGTGVCLEVTGMCRQTDDVVYVRADGSDTGDCTSGVPCLTMSYAFGKLTTARNVVHILGGTYSVGTNAVALPLQLLYIDGEDTAVRRAAQGAVFTASAQFVSAFIDHVTIGTNVSGNQSVAISAGNVLIHASTLQAPFAVTGGALEVADSTIEPEPSVTQKSQCSMGGTLSVHDSIVHSDLETTDCTATLARSRVDQMATGLRFTGTGISVIENNTFTSADYFTDALGVSGATGTTVRFNTFVNTSGVDMQAQAISCSGTVAVTSNIFAWHSSMPPGNCSVTYSLFDEIEGLQPGSGNHVGSAASFFVDMTNGDLHLSANSPAKGIAETGLPVPTDIEGNARPQPSTSQPDVGAYEAP